MGTISTLDPDPPPGNPPFLVGSEGQTLSFPVRRVFDSPIQIYLLASFSVIHDSTPSLSYTADREGEEVNHMTRYKNGQKERNTNRIYQHQITLYVSDAQMDFLESECNKLSMKLSTYIRDLIDKEKAEYESYLKK